jgi:hypothetical protein
MAMVLHSGHNVVVAASDMKPCAGIGEGGIPALQHVVRVREPLPQHVKGITCTNTQASPFTVIITTIIKVHKTPASSWQKKASITFRITGSR